MATWTTAFGNPQRTSFTSVEPAAKLNAQFYVAVDAYISPQVQPIVDAAGETVFLATSRGIYAINRSDGSKAWAYPTQLPFDCSPTWYAGKLYAAGLDQRVYCFEATTGALEWSTECDAGLSSNPLVFETGGQLHILVASRNGTVYSLTGSGGVRWQHTLPAPVMSTMAANDDYSRVYVACFDCQVYAFGVNGGTPASSVKFPGPSDFRAMAPVFDGHNNLLWVAGSPNYRTWATPGTQYPNYVGTFHYEWIKGDATFSPGNWLYGTGQEAGPWPDGSLTLNVAQGNTALTPPSNAPVGMYDDHPQRQTLYLLDADTLAEYKTDLDGDGQPEVYPIVFSGTNSGRTSMPAIAPDGKVYIKQLTKEGAPIPRGHICQWQPGTPILRPVLSTEEAVDEPTQLTIAGDKLLWHQTCNREMKHTNRHDDVPFNSFVMVSEWSDAELGYPDFEDGLIDVYYATSYKAFQGLWASFGGLNGIYGNHTFVGNAVPLPDGGMVAVMWNCLCFWTPKSTTLPAPRVTRLAIEAPAGSLPFTPPDLQGMIHTQVDLITSAGHLRPGYYVHGNLDKDLEGTMWWDGGAGYSQHHHWVLYALLRAFPHVDATRQAAIEAYIRSEYTQWPSHGHAVARIGWYGAAREWQDIPTDGSGLEKAQDDIYYDNGPFGKDPMAIYVSMLCHQQFSGAPFDVANAYATLQADWNANWKTTYEDIRIPPEPPGADQDLYMNQMKMHWLINDYIAGFMAYKWFAEQNGDTAKAAEIQDKITYLLNKWADDLSVDHGFNQDSGLRSVNVARVWYCLIPEIVAWIKANRPEVLPTVDDVMAQHEWLGPFWPYVFFYTTSAESQTHHLYDRWFLAAKAWFQNAPQEELARYLDIPAFARGDTDHLLNLVTVYEAEPASGAPAISNVDVPAAVDQGSKLEISFDLDSVATNLFLPYDADPPSGQTEVGVTVYAEFTTPDGGTLQVPAFYYQHFTTERRDNRDWIMPDPSGDGWRVRFTPEQAGNWSVRLAAEDQGGSTTTTGYSFTVSPASGKGFIRVNGTDPRYFSRQNGDVVPGLGYNAEYGHFNWNDPTENDAEFQTLQDNGIDLMRWWLSQYPIYSATEHPLKQNDAVYRDPGLAFLPPLHDAEVSWFISTTVSDYQSRSMILGWNVDPLPVKPGTTYKIRFRAYIPQALDVTGELGGFVLKHNPGWLEGPQIASSDFGTVIAGPLVDTGGAWTTVEGAYTTGATQNYLPWLFWAMQDCVADGKLGYFDAIEIREDLGGGNEGPNLFDMGRASQHLYVSQRYSWAADYVFEQAAAHDVSLKIVLLEKNDQIFLRMKPDGSLDNSGAWSNDNFYGPPDQTVTRSRWLQRAWFRYVTARWGYATAVHSWEALNEGDPSSERHRQYAKWMVGYMRQQANVHPSATSFWAGAIDWLPDVDYLDRHKYVDRNTNPNWGDTMLEQIAYVGTITEDGVPTVAGETALITGSYSSWSPEIEDDANGEWLRQWIWTQTLHGASSQLPWWGRQTIRAPGHESHYRAVRDFLIAQALDLYTYADGDFTGTAADLDVVGKVKDDKTRFLLFVRAGGTPPASWWEYAQGNTPQAVTGDVVVAGLLPSTAYSVVAYSSQDGTTQLAAHDYVTDKQGVLTLAASSFAPLQGLQGHFVVAAERMPVAAPTDLSASIVLGKPSLAWKDNALDETGYEVERRVSSSPYALLATLPADATAYVDEGAVEGTTYHYRVRAVRNGSYSDYSNEVSVTVAGGGPQLSNIKVPASARQYDRLEISFDLTTRATNLFLPYDAQPPAGQTAVGVSVDAKFTAPDGVVTMVPAFFYRSYTSERRNDRDWIYPAPEGDGWKVAFAPVEEGLWSVRLVATDADGSTTSDVFTVEVAPGTSRGFIRRAEPDTRYWSYDNGELFKGLGYNMALQELDWNSPSESADRFEAMGTYGVDFIRYQLAEAPVFGGVASPLRQHDKTAPGDTEPSLMAGPGGKGHDAEVAWVLHTSNGEQTTRFLMLGWQTEPLAVKPNTTYRIILKHYIPKKLVPAGSGDAGFVIKTSPTWLEASQIVSNTDGQARSAYQLSTKGWETLAATYTTGPEENYLPYIYFALVNVAGDGKAVCFDQVEIREDHGAGTPGVNLFDKGVADQHMYVSGRTSWSIDRFLQFAEQNSVALKIVLLDQTDAIFTRMQADGTIVGEQSADNFYGPEDQSVTRSRWLQRAFWRYCQARWGCSPAVHSWELCHAGDPASTRHYALAEFMGATMRGFGDNSHPVTTSFWEGFPAREFWANHTYASIGYADLHRDLTRDDPQWGDTAMAHIQHAAQLPFVGKPVVRGETMVMNAGGGSYAPELLKDTGGVWLKHWLWAQLHWNQLFELWRDAAEVITQETTGGVDQRRHFLALANFLGDIPLGNGHYKDAAATGRYLLVVGQKDTVNNRAHLWVRANGPIPCTWWNVVNGARITRVTSDIVIPGMAPRTRYAVRTISTADGMTILDSVELKSDRWGTLLLRSVHLKALRNLASDIAIKIDLADKETRKTMATHRYSTPSPLKPYMAQELDGLPDDARVEGWPINFSADRSMYLALELHVAAQAGPRKPGACVAIYCLRSLDGVNYAYGGADLEPASSDLLCTLSLDASHEARYMVADGLRAPVTMAKLLVCNMTGQPLAASGNVLRYRLYSTMSETL